MKATKMFCGELEGELFVCQLGFRAREVRVSIATLFPRTNWPGGEQNSWSDARKAGWRVVPVRVVPWESREARTANEVAAVLAQLRHAYHNLIDGCVIDQKEFANGLIAPQIRRLEKLR